MKVSGIESTAILSPPTPGHARDSGREAGVCLPAAVMIHTVCKVAFPEPIMTRALLALGLALFGLQAPAFAQAEAGDSALDGRRRNFEFTYQGKVTDLRPGHPARV